MRVYGISAFECERLYEGPNACLNGLEAYYAEQYGSYVWDGGYNAGECGKAPVRRDVSDTTRIWMKRRVFHR
jgi:hypothetical protein